MLGPRVERLWRVAILQLGVAAHQPCVDEISGHIGERGEFLGVGEHRRRLVLASQCQEFRAGKAGVAYFQYMAQPDAIDFPWQQRKKRLEVLGLERLARRELPDDRPELGTQFGNAAVEKALDRLPAFGQYPAVGRKTRRLDRENEIVGRLLLPLDERRAFLRAVVGAVDLDRRQPAAGELELARLRQFLRIERAAPGGIGPAANADADHTGLSRCIRCHDDPPSI